MFHEVSGTPFTAGAKIGILFKKSIQKDCQEDDFTAEFLADSLSELKTVPMVFQLLAGMAKGSGVSQEQMLSCWIRELKSPPSGFNDIIVSNAASQTQEIFITHLNITQPNNQLKIVKIEINDHPSFFAFFAGVRLTAIASSMGFVLLRGRLKSSKDFVDFLNLAISGSILGSLDCDFILATEGGSVRKLIENETLATKYVEKNYGQICFQNLVKVLGTHGPSGFCSHEDYEPTSSLIFKPEIRVCFYSPCFPCKGKYEMFRY